MSLTSRTFRTILAITVAGVAACASDDGAPSTTSSTTSELDVIGLAERPASLLVLSPSATPAQRRRLEQTLARLGGGVLESQGSRLVIAQVPPGAEAALTQLGVLARFDRAVTAADLTAPTLLEERFLSVYAARWFPSEVPGGERLAPSHVRRAASEGEAPAREVPEAARLAAAAAGTVDPEDTVSIPYASGTVVVSIILPESNGSVDPSTEDWNETLLRETYLKVQAAIDVIAAAEPNADLRYVVHYESAPAAGALLGTVDTNFEFGQRAQWGSPTEQGAIADVLTRLVNHPVAEGDVYAAAVEYTASLKARYQADHAFFVMVAANGGGTASLRAHAYVHGPLTILDTNWSWQTFAHEFGHIFGAQDEYCPDACVSPSAVTGYLGMYNANAFSTENGGGIDHGHGESVTSLMESNNPDMINGYTRGAWGWIDTDGDGLFEVRDTLPKSELTASANGTTVRLTGRIVDRPDSRQQYSIRYSSNRIVALEYAIDSATGPWFRVPLAGDTRGRQAVDVQITGVRAGARRLYVRGVSSVGNVEPRPLQLTVTTTGTANGAPHLRLDVPARAGTAAPVTVTTTVRDLDGDAVQVRYDLDGNGSWDTAYRAAGAFAFTPAAGVVTVRAQAKDARNATRIVTAELPVVTGNAAPLVALTAVPSLVHGVPGPTVTTTATATDPEGGAVALNVITELATADDQFRTTGAAGATGQVAVTLPTPESLKSRALDLTAGDLALQAGWIRDLLALDANHLVVAAGAKGIWIVDLTERTGPRIMATLALETTANKLYRVGTKLYVLGTYLTVVDLTNLRAPRELKQLSLVTTTVTADATDPVDIADGSEWPVPQYFYINHGAKITASRVTVTIDHPRPADLKIQLSASKDHRLEPIVLWDHRAGGATGLRTLTFTSANTPALRVLDGRFPEGDWRVEVLDDQGNGQAGRLVSSRVQFTTSARAAKVIDGAAEIAGVTSAGNLVIAGNGVEALEVSFPQLVRSLGKIAGTGAQTATMSGDTVITSSGLQVKEGAPVPRLRGLCAVDLRIPVLPRVVRCEAGSTEPTEHAQVAGRLYVSMIEVCEGGDPKSCGAQVSTVIGDASRFARNLSWRLGTSSLHVDRFALGDAQRMWTVGQGFIQELDVANPALLASRRHYPRTRTARLIALRLPEVVLFDYGMFAKLAVLGEGEHILSRTYRITVEARDAAGAVTRTSRTVHAIPYDHAPVAVSAAVVPGKSPGDPNRLRVQATDVDGGFTWDPSNFARIDWDGDGSFDTDWMWLGNDGTGRFSTDLELTVPAGTYPAVVEVRDGFWARGRLATTIVVP